MLNDAEFASQIIDYLDSIISEYIDACESENSLSPMSVPSAQNFETDQDYVHTLQRYGNEVASKQQIHSGNHNSTCFKYSKKEVQKCKFSFTCPKVEESYVNELGIAHLCRDNEWVNSYNS